MKTAVISVTKAGDAIADKLSAEMEIDLYSKYRNKDFDINKASKYAFENYRSIIYICSTGIAVRSLAPYLKGKAADPGVVVIDSSGRFSISLTGGHLGGANDLCLRVSEITGAEAVITTATDNLGITAPDVIAARNGLIVDDLKAAKNIAALMVQREKIAFTDFKKEISKPDGYSKNSEDAKGIVYVTDRAREEIPDDIKALKLVRRDIILGIGCRKSFSAEKMLDTVMCSLASNNIDKRAVKAVATIDIKSDEEAIIKLVQYFNAEFYTFSKEEIKKVQDKYDKSSFVDKVAGVSSVCEPCTELAGGNIIKGKMKLDGMTLCIGRL